jgi:hypothetical protein
MASGTGVFHWLYYLIARGQEAFNHRERRENNTEIAEKTTGIVKPISNSQGFVCALCVISANSAVNGFLQ